MDQDMKQILVAIDLGDDTGKIIAYALWLAAYQENVRTGTAEPTEIDLLYVLDYGFTPPTYLSPYIEKEKELDETEIKKWEGIIRSFGIQTTHRIAAGRLLETFASALKELRADVMVLGHASHLVRPSTSERLIRSLETHMLVVRGEKAEGATPGKLGIKKILCAVDFSDNSKKALAYARELADRSSAALAVVYVVSSHKMETGFRKWQDMNEADKTSYRNDLIGRAEAEMRSLLSSLANECRDVECIVRTGITYKTINEVAAENNADMIVIGARGLSYIKGIMLGSVTESIIKSSPCPVMIVR